MNTKVILSGLKSPAYQEVANTLCDIVERVKQKTITYKQGLAEIAGFKHIIQLYALDLQTLQTEKTVKKLTKK